MSRLWENLTYPRAPGFVAHSSTSKAAADGISPRLLGLRYLVLDLFRAAGERGLTDEELQAATNIRSVLRPRRIELTALGKIKASGRTRLTGSNRKAEVWILACPSPTA